MAFYFTNSQKEEIGKNIRRIRRKKGLKQIDVATAATINESYYSKVEKGLANITLEKLYKIVKALDSRSEDILPF